MLTKPQLIELIKDRILILDGAMGTEIQGYNLSEADFKGEEYKNWNYELKGNNDILSITKPKLIKEILAYLYLLDLVKRLKMKLVLLLDTNLINKIQLLQSLESSNINLTFHRKILHG